MHPHMWAGGLSSDQFCFGWSQNSRNPVRNSVFVSKSFHHRSLSSCWWSKRIRVICKVHIFLINYTLIHQCSCVISNPGLNQYLDTGSMGVNGSSASPSPLRFTSFSEPRLALQLGKSLVRVKVCRRRRMSSSVLKIFVPPDWASTLPTKYEQSEAGHHNTGPVPAWPVKIKRAFLTLRQIYVCILMILVIN